MILQYFKLRDGNNYILKSNEHNSSKEKKSEIKTYSKTKRRSLSILWRASQFS